MSIDKRAALEKKYVDEAYEKQIKEQNEEHLQFIMSKFENTRDAIIVSIKADESIKRDLKFTTCGFTSLFHAYLTGAKTTTGDMNIKKKQHLGEHVIQFTPFEDSEDLLCYEIISKYQRLPQLRCVIKNISGSYYFSIRFYKGYEFYKEYRFNSEMECVGESL